eukprot:10771916-Lingulodinium_polyedra.AAC.1
MKGEAHSTSASSAASSAGRSAAQRGSSSGTTAVPRALGTPRPPGTIREVEPVAVSMDVEQP